jgi:hypothetical protein
VLEGMPSLVDAFVTLCDSNFDSCDSSYSGDCDDIDCFPCLEVDEDTNKSVLLQGLSEAQTLTLISDVEIVCQTLFIHLFVFTLSLHLSSNV